jgi:hypothetical protein
MNTLKFNLILLKKSFQGNNCKTDSKTPGLFPGGFTPRKETRKGRGTDHPPPSSAEVKERVELYLYSPSGHTWPVLG